MAQVVAPIDFNGNKAVDLGDPTDPQDAATKAYVDAHDIDTTAVHGIANTALLVRNPLTADLDTGGFSIVNAPASGNASTLTTATALGNGVAAVGGTAISANGPTFIDNFADSSTGAGNARASNNAFAGSGGATATMYADSISGSAFTEVLSVVDGGVGTSDILISASHDIRSAIIHLIADAASARIGFFGSTPIVQPAATGLAALWTALKNLGFLTTGSTAPTPYEPGGTDVAVADGGTGASTAAGARTNLGLGTMAVEGTTAGGDVSGVWPTLAVTDDSHSHGAGTAPGSGAAPSFLSVAKWLVD